MQRVLLERTDTSLKEKRHGVVKPISQERRMWQGLMLIYTQNHLVVEGFMLMLKRELCTDYHIRFSILITYALLR